MIPVQDLSVTLHSGEPAHHAIDRCLATFTILGVPHHIKTDNGPAYTSKPFHIFCKKLNTKHVTGTPYNPVHQGMVERAHATIKMYLQKTKKGGLCPPCSSRAQLNHVLFILNFLTLDKHGNSAAERFWHPETARHYAMVKWRDTLNKYMTWTRPRFDLGQGYVCVFSQVEDAAQWLLERLVQQVDYIKEQAHSPSDNIADSVAAESSSEG